MSQCDRGRKRLAGELVRVSVPLGVILCLAPLAHATGVWSELRMGTEPAEAIVVATVTDTTTILLEPEQFGEMWTKYDLRVEDQLKGEPFLESYVWAEGGRLGKVDSGLKLAIGSQYVLFTWRCGRGSEPTALLYATLERRGNRFRAVAGDNGDADADSVLAWIEDAVADCEPTAMGRRAGCVVRGQIEWIQPGPANLPPARQGGRIGLRVSEVVRCVGGAVPAPNQLMEIDLATGVSSVDGGLAWTPTIRQGDDGVALLEWRTDRWRLLESRYSFWLLSNGVMRPTALNENRCSTATREETYSWTTVRETISAQ